MNILSFIFAGFCLINFCEEICCWDYFTTQDFEYDLINSNDEHRRAARQLITGTVPSFPSGSTCICVPSGTCSTSPSSDGSGQIDIRIVTNGGGTPTTPPQQSCSFGLVLCCQTGPYRCGIRYPPPSTASSTAAPGQAPYGSYPWQAAILTLGNIYLGSGALIDNRHILTVAHKVYNVSINSIKVRLGEWDTSATNEPIPAQEFSIARAFIHPNFNSSNLFNDVALLRFSTPVNLGATSTVAAVCLPFMSFVGSVCYVSGWGKDNFGPNGNFQSVLKQVDVLVKDTTQCQNELRGTRLGPNFVLNGTSFICAGGQSGKDACTGDGGSPLVCQNNGSWFVVGLVAWGIGCAVGGVSGVYVNVASYIPWIFSSINTQ